MILSHAASDAASSALPPDASPAAPAPSGSPMPQTDLPATLAQLGIPGSVPVAAEALPPALAPLLTGTRGMTAALAAAWGEPMALEVLFQVGTDAWLRRDVLLRGTASGRVAEYGRIAIHLAALPEPLRQAVRDGTAPFGALLAEAGIGFGSRPAGFFTLDLGQGLAARFDLPVGTVCHGRHTHLTTDDGTLLAAALELIAPAG